MLNLLSGDVELNPGPNKCRALKLCHVNIRSLSRSKLLAIKTSLIDLYDIITISETHLHAGVPNDLFKIQGFHDIIRKDRGSEGGGVAMFIRDSIGYKRVYKYEKPDIEAIWVQINTIEGKVLVCSCYRPPDKGSFWNDFETVLDEIKQDQVNNTIILGDLNADFNADNGPKLIQFCNAQNLHYLVTEPTRITNTTSTILDQILTNAPSFLTKIEVTPPVSTNDHCTVGAHFNFKVEKEKAYKRHVWLFKNANFDQFREALSNTNFEDCFEIDDVDKTCDQWSEKFLNVAKATIPNKVVTIRPNDSPWYSNELRLLKRQMLRAFHKHKKSALEKDWVEYKKLRNDYQKSLDEAEAGYKRSLASSLSNNRNTKTWWQTVKWLIGKGGDTSYPALSVNDKSITSNKDKAQAFNDFFLSHSNVDDLNAELPDDQEFPQGIDTIAATEQEVYDLIRSVDPSKATGPDGINPRLLKEAGLCIVPSLTRLINLSLSKAIVPKRWKLANVTPLFKKGEKNDTNNYRPVSLLSCVSKILERIVFKHLFNFLRDRNFISPHQSGFQPGDSTVNQLSYLYHTFAEALDKKKDVHIVFCDVKKAFDRVWHRGLLYKLQKAGVFGTLLEWFKNYLSDRYQQVVVRGETSELGLIKAGVPQGSILGPLLFLIYMNDITTVTQCNIKLFADDTSLYIEFDNNDDATARLNQDLTRLQNWADQWLVKFCPNKSKLMTCTFKKRDPTNIVFNNVQLDSVKSHKHLGLVFSSDLTWTSHVQSILQNVSPLVDVLKSLKYDIDRKTLETTYFSFIRPKLEYGCHIWDNCSERDSDQLETIQLSMARIVTGARRGTSHQLLYQDTNWLTLKERRELIKLKNFTRIVNGDTPQYLRDLLPHTFGSIRENARNPDNFHAYKARTETYKSSFLPSSIFLWNSKSPDERTVEYITAFMKTKCNVLYYYGERKVNIIHAQLRLKCSKLNAHLFSLHVVESPSCLCGNNNEDSEHYLLHCPLYQIFRHSMLDTISTVINIDEINLKTLLYGNEMYDYDVNCKIFEAVHKFILDSGRL